MLPWGPDISPQRLHTLASGLSVARDAGHASHKIRSILEILKLSDKNVDFWLFSESYTSLE